MVKRTILLPASMILVLLGCAEVIGTADLCDEETCEGGAGGGTGSTTTGTSTTSTGTGSTGTAGGCVDLTVNVNAAVDVKLEGGLDVDWSAGGIATQCIPVGPVLLRAECADGELKGDPVVVEWGNALCQPSSTCAFDLSQPTAFAVTLAAGASCP